MAEENGTMQYNKDEVNPPEFLNEQYFENALRKAENDKALKITNLQLLPGTKPGDHFASIMFKAIISYTSKGKEVNSRSLIVKTMPIEDGIKMTMLQEMPFFKTEISMYTEILPEMKRIMESIGDYEEMFPKLVYCGTEPPTLIFEDITKHGYAMHNGFYDFENAMKVVKKLAKFHALSYYMNDNKYSYKFDFTQFKTIMTEQMFEKFKIFFEGFEYIKDEVASWPGYESFAEKLSGQSKNFFHTLLKVYEPNDEPELNVLCHGDFHIRNMMFIEKDANIDKTMFLDFQICFWGSPLIDLFYVLYSIGSTECRNRREEVLTIYHNFFSDYLKQLGCLRKPPTLLQLNIEMLKKGTMEVLWGICFYPFFCLDFTKVDMDTVVNPDEQNKENMKELMYKNKEYLAVVKEVLPYMVYKGIL
ncbi:uncharacterized protein LOC132264900 [Phlebotomus argentipes]|uniref:uncharacterized protein LOC132264900 n=1 Tax=Phlebotomus argentipes TaxID=94469 RepID=UPI0028931A04|nr:uncharacterized protein LOC132264900 [Phlebotomus argentipes]